MRAELHADEQTQREATVVATREVCDRKDEAEQRSLSDLQRALEQRDADEMAQIEGAVRRLEGGTYGACTDCGLPISHLSSAGATRGTAVRTMPDGFQNRP